MSELYFGRGNASMRDDYLDFINLVFGFNGVSPDFLKMYPNLYKAEYDPCYNNFVATEDGKLRAAIGVYPRTFSVMGEVLLSHGIGNVAVHPYLLIPIFTVGRYILFSVGLLGLKSG